MATRLKLERTDSLVALGFDTYALASEIVAILEPEKKLSWEKHRCTLILRNGQKIPAYKTAATIRQRWQAALSGEA